MKRESKWTHVYFDADVTAELKTPWYVRFTPDFMNLEAAGFSHGISISGNKFATREEAEKAADVYDKFFDMMYIAIIDDHEEAK